MSSTPDPKIKSSGLYTYGKTSSSLFSMDFATATAKQTALWGSVYLFGYLRWDLRWLALMVCFLGLVYIWQSQRRAGAGNQAGQQGLSPAPGPMWTDDLPMWVVNPDTHRAEWTNVIFRQLWPHLEEFLKQTLSTVENDLQLRERLTGYHIKNVRFPHVSLGNIPPRLSGVKVHKTVHRDEIILDMAVQYNGNLNICMEADLAGAPDFLPPAKASISNMTFTGTLRVHLRPLLRDVPFVGGVTMSFLKAPEIDFDLGGLANALDLPGVGLVLRHVIQDQLEQTFVMPNSISMPLVSLEVSKNLRFPVGEANTVALPAGVLSVNIVEAKSLVNKDKVLLGTGKSDPYAKIRILVDGTAHTFRTDTVANNLDPVWKLMIDMPVDNPESLDDVNVELWDEDVGTKDDFLGRCTIPLTVIRRAMTSSQTQDVWKTLDDTKKGSFHATISWCELKLSRPNVQDEYHRGVLSVVIDSCTSLLSGRLGLKLPNPSVRVELCGISQVTEAVIGNVNPVFAHRMNFLVRDPDSDTLKINVIDSKRAESLGYLRIDLSSLLDRTSLSMTNQQFNLITKSVKGERSPQICLSLAFRYIYRPKTTSYGVHSSLSDLNKIMQKTLTPGSSGIDLNGKPPPAVEYTVNGDAFGKFAEDRESIPYIDETASAKTSSPKHPPPGPLPPRQSPQRSSMRHMDRLDKRQSNNQLRRSVNGNFRTKDNLAKEKAVKATPAQKAPQPPDLRPKIHLSLKYSQKTMTLSVIVHKLRNLQEFSYSLFPSPYVKLYLLESVGMSSHRRRPNSKRKTTVQKAKANPIYEETLEYFLPPNEMRYRRLEVSVCSSGGLLGRNVVMGRCLVNLDTISLEVDSRKQSEATVTSWHVLNPEERFLTYSSSSNSLPRSQSAHASMMSSSVKLERKRSANRSRSPSSASLPGG